MPAAARAQLQSGSGGRGGMRPETWMADGLRGHQRGLQAGLGKARSQLSERDFRARKSDERKSCGVDLEWAKAQAAAADGDRCCGNVPVALRLSRGVIRRTKAPGEGTGPTAVLAEVGHRA